MKRLLLSAGLVLLVLVVIWDQRRRAPEVQVPATFARLAAAVADHDAAGVMASVDLGYDFAATWPAIFPAPEQARATAQRYLALAFLQQREQPVTMTWTLHGMQVLPDGSVQAEVSLQVSGGLFTTAIPPLTRHRFHLVRSSPLTGRYRIRDHAPFALTLPDGN